MSKEKKLAKKEQKAAKKAAKLEKSQAKSYAKLVKKIDKKNAKAEKKADKKGKPFEPIPVPTQEEAFAAGDAGHKGRRIFLMILLIFLIIYTLYFLIMFIRYEAPPFTDNSTTISEDGSKVPVEYDRYTNPHKITTTPDYTVSEAKVLLKQVLHDNWNKLGYSSDPSSGSINYTSNIVNVNNSDCYVFTAGSKTYAVSTKLSAVYVNQNGRYEPLTFHEDDILF